MAARSGVHPNVPGLIAHAAKLAEFGRRGGGTIEPFAVFEITVNAISGKRLSHPTQFVLRLEPGGAVERDIELERRIDHLGALAVVVVDTEVIDGVLHATLVAETSEARSKWATPLRSPGRLRFERLDQRFTLAPRLRWPSSRSRVG
jgi:hypothetical protein